MIRFLLQGVTPNDDHVGALEYLLELPNTETILISVAFARLSGVVALEQVVENDWNRVKMFVGVRNGVTSIQALLRVLNLGADLHVVDTGSSNTIYHPKVYLAKSNDEARLMVGSANLTMNGLGANIEASIVAQLRLQDPNGLEVADDILARFALMTAQHPQNVLGVSDWRRAFSLFRKGLVVDERTTQRPSVGGTNRSGARDSVPSMALHRASMPPRPGVSKRRARRNDVRPTNIVASEWVKVWQSRPLTERDLNIPTGAHTNPTGSMLFKKGVMEDIDQRHYFYDVVFNDLSWGNDPASRAPHLLRAEADFEIVITGVNQGRYRLKLTHNPLTNTPTYHQRNAMTQIHWGTALNLVAYTDLLGRTMTMYKSNGKQITYVLEIE